MFNNPYVTSEKHKSVFDFNMIDLFILIFNVSSQLVTIIQKIMVFSQGVQQSSSCFPPNVDYNQMNL